jgi:hypothetical protein
VSRVVEGACAARWRGRRGSDARRGFLLPNGVVVEGRVEVGFERVLPEGCGAVLVVIFIVEKAVEPMLLFDKPHREESQQDQHSQTPYNAPHYGTDSIRFPVVG